MATIFVPFIALIVALVMLGNETNPVKRAFLKTWAWASGGVLALFFVIGVIAFASVANSVPTVSTNGPCEGGPILNAPGVPLGNNRYRFACVDGGSTIVKLP